MKRILLLALLATTIVSSNASAQDRSLRTANRIGLVFGGEFGGESSLHINPDADGLPETEVSGDLDPSLVVGLRLIHPMQTYVTLGTELRLIRYRGEDGDDRSSLIDFSFMPAVRYPFAIGDLELEPYLGLPLGLTVNVLNEDPPGDAGKGSVGFHIGVLAGLAMQLPFGLGFFVEAGWLHHQAFDSDDIARYRLTLNQAAFHVGVTYAF